MSPRVHGRHSLSGTDRPERSQSSYRLQSAYAAKDSREAAELYDSWAEDYERKVSSWGYTTPAIAAWFLGRYVAPEDGAVVDAGTGTGLMGVVLAPLGYRDLLGLECSSDMRAHARKKGAYKELHPM